MALCRHELSNYDLYGVDIHSTYQAYLTGFEYNITYGVVHLLMVITCALMFRFDLMMSINTRGTFLV